MRPLTPFLVQANSDGLHPSSNGLLAELRVLFIGRTSDLIQISVASRFTSWLSGALNEPYNLYQSISTADDRLVSETVAIEDSNVARLSYTLAM